MATVRPGVFEIRDAPRQARIEAATVRPVAADWRVEVLDRQIDTADVGLADVDVIIAGGAGCDAGSWQLVEDLTGAIGGRVAASGGAVESGLAPRRLQVGQTGQPRTPVSTSPAATPAPSIIGPGFAAPQRYW
jgi:electron transfer flavoprotein alpha subunit